MNAMKITPSRRLPTDYLKGMLLMRAFIRSFQRLKSASVSADRLFTEDSLEIFRSPVVRMTAIHIVYKLHRI